MNLKVSDAKREDGFTLIELLVVVIIIGILAAIAIPVFLNQRERAWQGTTESDVRNAAIEVETQATRDGDYEVLTAGDVQLSAGVTLTQALAGGDSTRFLMCGQHNNIAAGSVVYDSNAGGLQDWDDTNLCAANPDFTDASAVATETVTLP